MDLMRTRLMMAAGSLEIAMVVIPFNHPGVKQDVLDAAKLAGEALREFPDKRNVIEDVPAFLAPATASEQRAIERLKATELDCAYWPDDVLLEIVRAVRGGIK